MKRKYIYLTLIGLLVFLCTIYIVNINNVELQRNNNIGETKKDYLFDKKLESTYTTNITKENKF